VVENDFLDSYHLPLEGKQARYAQLLHTPPAGLTEWAVHSSTGSAESQAIDSGWRQRRADCEFLTSPQAREIIEEAGIAVIDYRPLQQAWSQSRPPPVSPIDDAPGHSRP
jgi:chitin disaccharide deacetylase